MRKLVAHMIFANRFAEKDELNLNALLNLSRGEMHFKKSENQFPISLSSHAGIVSLVIESEVATYGSSE